MKNKNHKDDRHPEVSQILESTPNWITRWGFILIFVILCLLTGLSLLVPYKQTVTLSVRVHALKHFDQRTRILFHLNEQAESGLANGQQVNFYSGQLTHPVSGTIRKIKSTDKSPELFELNPQQPLAPEAITSNHSETSGTLIFTKEDESLFEHFFKRLL